MYYSYALVVATVFGDGVGTEALLSLTLSRASPDVFRKSLARRRRHPTATTARCLEYWNVLPSPEPEPELEPAFGLALALSFSTGAMASRLSKTSFPSSLLGFLLSVDSGRRGDSPLISGYSL